MGPIVWEYDSTCSPAGIVVDRVFHPSPRPPVPPKQGSGWELVALCFGDGMLYAAWRRDVTVLRKMQAEAKKR